MQGSTNGVAPDDASTVFPRRLAPLVQWVGVAPVVVPYPPDGQGGFDDPP